MYQVEGFVFETEEMADQAKREADGIRYIQKQTPLNDPGVVLKLYNKLLEQEIFETVVGIGFLQELQHYLYRQPEVLNRDILPIPVPAPKVSELRELAEEKDGGLSPKPPQPTAPEKQEPEEPELTQAGKRYRRKFHVAMFFAVVFFCVIAGIFAITYFSGKNKNILNYENEIINQYESWQVELEEKEDELNAREKELEKREALLESQMRQ